MIKYGSETIPQLQINVPDQFVVPEVRTHLYVPGSGVAEVSLFGKISFCKLQFLLFSLLLLTFDLWKWGNRNIEFSLLSSIIDFEDGGHYNFTNYPCDLYSVSAIKIPTKRAMHISWLWLFIYILQVRFYWLFIYISTGDVVTPGFITYYMNCEDIFRKPYGAAEMNMFNFAYNLLTLKFKKANQQLDPDVLSRTLDYLNVGMYIFINWNHYNSDTNLFDGN